MSVTKSELNNASILVILKDTDKWADIYQDGKRLETLIKQCYTKTQKPRKKKGSNEPSRPELPEELKLAYMDRMIKAQMAKLKIIETILDVKRLVR